VTMFRVQQLALALFVLVGSGESTGRGFSYNVTSRGDANACLRVQFDLQIRLTTNENRNMFEVIQPKKVEKVQTMSHCSMLTLQIHPQVEMHTNNTLELKLHFSEPGYMKPVHLKKIQISLLGRNSDDVKYFSPYRSRELGLGETDYEEYQIGHVFVDNDGYLGKTIQCATSFMLRSWIRSSDTVAPDELQLHFSHFQADRGKVHKGDYSLFSKHFLCDIDHPYNKIFLPVFITFIVLTVFIAVIPIGRTLYLHKKTKELETSEDERLIPDDYSYNDDPRHCASNDNGMVQHFSEPKYSGTDENDRNLSNMGEENPPPELTGILTSDVSRRLSAGSLNRVRLGGAVIIPHADHERDGGEEAVGRLTLN